MILSNKYKMVSILNKGEFGVVYQGENIRHKEKVAIKVEPNNDKGLLKHETIVYQYLRGVNGVPNVKWYGVTKNIKYLVLPLYRASISSILHSHNIDWHKIGKELLSILGEIHSKGIIHRDIKPTNIMIGENNKYYFIDFGFAKSYLDSNNQHIPLKETTNFVGSLNYASINIHNGLEYSRRDDVVSLGYVILYIYNKGLVWENMVDISDILEQKMLLLEEETNNIIINFLLDSYNLKFKEKPNYEYFN